MAAAGAGFLRVWVSLRRYPFNLVAGLITVFLLFLLLFYGISLVPAGFQLGQTRGALVVGFISWLAMLAAFQDFTERITQGAGEGT
ncbi:MAG: hypothetical protein AB1609_18840 [Bacillota bacterium]